MLSQIIFEQIKDNFYYGAYGEFRVIVDKSNGYVNATKMCKSLDKKFKDWPRLKGSQVLIQTFLSEKVLSHTNSNSDLTLEKTEAQICASVIPPCISINTGNKTDVEQLISGTYAHPLLIPSIAGWISPEFQIKANEVVNGYIVKQYKDIIESQQEAKEEAIQQCEAAKL
jgi:KilA-N domain